MKTYQAPALELLTLANEDILTASYQGEEIDNTVYDGNNKIELPWI